MYEPGTVDCFDSSRSLFVTASSVFLCELFYCFVFVAAYMCRIFEVRDVIIFCLEIVVGSLGLSSNYRFTYL